WPAANPDFPGGAAPGSRGWRPSAGPPRCSSTAVGPRSDQVMVSSPSVLFLLIGRAFAVIGSQNRCAARPACRNGPPRGALVCPAPILRSPRNRPTLFPDDASRKCLTRG